MSRNRYVLTAVILPTVAKMIGPFQDRAEQMTVHNSFHAIRGENLLHSEKLNCSVLLVMSYHNRPDIPRQSNVINMVPWVITCLKLLLVISPIAL